MTFAATFREVVGPVLRERCAVAGLMVQRGRWTWLEAEEFVWALARRRGALRLPDHIFHEVENWVSGLILQSVAACETDEGARPIIDRLITAAMARHG